MRVMGIAADAVMYQSRRLEKSAERTASMGRKPVEGEKPVDLVEETVERMDASRVAEANLKVIKSEDERLKHLLDIIA